MIACLFYVRFSLVAGTPTPRGVLSEQMPQRNHLKRSYALLGSSIFVVKSTLKLSHVSFIEMSLEAYTIPLLTPSSRLATDTEILLKLDDYNQPGLYDDEFRALLGRMVRCSCKMIMLRRVFEEHRCNLAHMRPLKRQRLDGDDNGAQIQEE